MNPINGIESNVMPLIALIFSRPANPINGIERVHCLHLRMRQGNGESNKWNWKNFVGGIAGGAAGGAESNKWNWKLAIQSL